MNQRAQFAEEQPASYRDPESFSARAGETAFRFYPDGQERREALLELIEDARETLDLAFYIYARDTIGAAVRDALVAAAARGVAVTLIVDGFGAEAEAGFFESLTRAGGTFCVFQARWSRRALIRNHQKMAIADNRRALLGGFNIADDYFAPPANNGWNDLAVRVEGPVVATLAQWFAQLRGWTLDEHAQFRDIRRRVREWDGGAGALQVLIGGPTRRLSGWGRRLARDIETGRRLDLVIAYFAPGRSIAKRLRRLARRGTARLVLAGKTDNGATLGAARMYYRRLLKAGARVYEFQPCKLHTKLIVIDDIVYLGSANLDMRSLYLNLEIMLRIEDAALAARMREFIDRHAAASLAITPETHRARATLLNRTRWAVSWFLVAVVDYTVSRRLNLGL